MESPAYRACPGCGVRLAVSDALADRRYNASAECWELYCELTAYTLARGYNEFIHQLAVDAYGAQHASSSGPTIGTAFALIGLSYTYERGYSGRQVQHMHILLARRTKSWPRFTAPAHAGPVTILDVMQTQPGEQRDAALRRWGQSVWDAWGTEHERVRALVENVLAD